MAGDLATAVRDRDRPRADRRGDAQPNERDRDRVAVLTDRDQRLGVDARRDLLGRLQRLVGQRAQQRPFTPQRFADRVGVPGDPSREIVLAASAQPSVELSQRRDGGDRDEMAATEATDLALDAALLMRALKPGQREL